jgi:hypothetical protein
LRSSWWVELAAMVANWRWSAVAMIAVSGSFISVCGSPSSYDVEVGCAAVMLI